jgi:PadR family transcriptional regulator AphA
MLSLGSKSGYDIKKTIAESTSNFRSESYGNIYPVFKKLLAQGAIRAENGDAPAGSRQKQLYSITKNGKKMLADWLRQPVIFRPKDDELLLKLFFGATVSPANTTERSSRISCHPSQEVRRNQAVHLDPGCHQGTEDILVGDASLWRSNQPRHG